VSIKWMLKALETKVGNPARKLVLIKLCDNANDNGECWPSYEYIADHCEISRRSVIDHINKLVEAGFINKTTRKGVKGNSANIYKMLFTPSAKSAPLDNAGHLRGENIAPLPSEESAPLDNTTPLRGADISPPSANIAPPSENSAPPPSANSAPGICHSFEPVIEPVRKGPQQLSPPNLFTNELPKREAFGMTFDWQPSESFINGCKFRGVNLEAIPSDEQEELLNEFRGYWDTQARSFTQVEWEHKLLNHLKRQQARKTNPNSASNAQTKRAVISAAIMDVEDTSW